MLSDGLDTDSSLRLSALVAKLEARSGSERRQIRIFTIAYGSDADQKGLESVATASSGKAYVGDPTEIEKVYLQISSFF